MARENRLDAFAHILEGNASEAENYMMDYFDELDLTELQRAAEQVMRSILTVRMALNFAAFRESQKEE